MLRRADRRNWRPARCFAARCVSVCVLVVESWFESVPVVAGVRARWEVDIHRLPRSAVTVLAIVFAAGMMVMVVATDGVLEVVADVASCIAHGTCVVAQIAADLAESAAQIWESRWLRSDLVTVMVVLLLSASAHGCCERSGGDQ